MRSAEELLRVLLVTWGGRPDEALALFTDDGVYEAPYLESLGLPWRYRGREEVGQVLRAHGALLPSREVHDVVIVCATERVVVAEYQYKTRSARTGRMIHQLIVGQLQSDGERIMLMRESLNLVEWALALYPRGLADYRVPSDRDTRHEQ